MFKIFTIDERCFTERMNLRPSKNLNLNFSCSDVVWSPHEDFLLATAATNGAVILWNLAMQVKAKQETTYQGNRQGGIGEKDVSTYKKGRQNW